MDDPRTLARDIPGLLEPLFPHLVAGVVAHINRRRKSIPGYKQILLNDVQASSLTPAMLFELAVVVAEQLLKRSRVNWVDALKRAVGRQSRHFDAKTPVGLNANDKELAWQVAENTLRMLEDIQGDIVEQDIVTTPTIPGYQWIATGSGDFSIGTCLIEVKCVNRDFGAADYRQVLIYWLLSYAAAVEGRGVEWSRLVLSNPRLGFSVDMQVNDLIRLLSEGRSKIELLQLFITTIDERRTHGQ